MAMHPASAPPRGLGVHPGFRRTGGGFAVDARRHSASGEIEVHRRTLLQQLRLLKREKHPHLAALSFGELTCLQWRRSVVVVPVVVVTRKGMGLVLAHRLLSCLAEGHRGSAIRSMQTCAADVDATGGGRATHTHFGVVTNRPHGHQLAAARVHADRATLRRPGAATQVRLAPPRSTSCGPPLVRPIGHGCMHWHWILHAVRRLPAKPVCIPSSSRQCHPRPETDSLSRHQGSNHVRGSWVEQPPRVWKAQADVPGP